LSLYAHGENEAKERCSKKSREVHTGLPIIEIKYIDKNMNFRRDAH
jgi:hypothetical protein